MAQKKQRVAGELYESITGQLFEIGRQLRQTNGYPYDAEVLKEHLQRAIEGRFFWDEFRLIYPKPFNPAEFISERWSIWRGPTNGNGLEGEEDIDSRSLGLAEIKVSSLLFETYPKDGQRITGEEKLKRLKAANLIRLGGNVFLGLWRDYEANRRNSILECLYKTRNITYLDFFGLILRSSDAYRYVLSLHREDGGWWGQGFRWLNSEWNTDDWSAVFASSH